MIVDSAREMTAKKFCRYGEYDFVFFEHLLFLIFFSFLLGYIPLLQQLTKVGDVSQEQFEGNNVL